MSAEQYGAYSVLMSVYSNENPTWLRLAIESMQTQTLPTSDFVLVCDEPALQELKVKTVKYFTELEGRAIHSVL